MACLLCRSDRFQEILQKPEIPVWTNAEDALRVPKRHVGVLRQCLDCHHVYQPVDDALQGLLTAIYQSHHAQASTSFGHGNWGVERGDVVLRALQEVVQLSPTTSVLEIGCADGYLLRHLRSQGLQKLAGIDPSLPQTSVEDGIQFMKAFATSELTLGEQYDLIVASAVFEHVLDIADMLTFCRRHLTRGGKLFFTVPDEHRLLLEGDPGSFMHQHLHYYTSHSVGFLLARCGFRIRALHSEKDALSVCAEATDRPSKHEDSGGVSYTYGEALERTLQHIGNVFDHDRIIVHGASNSLNNILGWLQRGWDGVLVDNDTTKHGKRYFGHTVHGFSEIPLKDFSAVFITTGPYFNDIVHQYKTAGFTGAILGARD